ncbi:MAG: 50S ribosomal protein L22 [Bacteroidia bacterium]|nr:50S ribosomal protein L22 [Bacteroidia bacterium]
MAEQVKMTRKEKIAAGIEKQPKRKKAMAERLKEERAEKTHVELRNYRSSARKMRLIVDQVRGMEVSHALNVLKLTQKGAAPDVLKLLKAAISSFEEKNEGERVEPGSHYVKVAMVDGGRMLKRLSPAPQGRGHLVRKRYCHVTLELDRIQTADN